MHYYDLMRRTTEGTRQKIINKCLSVFEVQDREVNHLPVKRRPLRGPRFQLRAGSLNGSMILPIFAERVRFHFMKIQAFIEQRIDRSPYI